MDTKQSLQPWVLLKKHTGVTSDSSDRLSSFSSKKKDKKVTWQKPYSCEWNTYIGYVFVVVL